MCEATLIGERHERATPQGAPHSHDSVSRVSTFLQVLMYVGWLTPIDGRAQVIARFDRHLRERPLAWQEWTVHW
jgi:hypothetical protein